MTVSLLVTTFTRLWGWNDRCSELHYGNWWDPWAWPGAKNQYVLASANLILTILFKSVCCETPKRNAESLECLFKKALNITFIKSCTSLHFALFHTFSTLFLTLDHSWMLMVPQRIIVFGVWVSAKLFPQNREHSCVMSYKTAVLCPWE